MLKLENGQVVCACAAGEQMGTLQGIQRCVPVCPTSQYILTLNGNNVVCTCPTGTYIPIQVF